MNKEKTIIPWSGSIVDGKTVVSEIKVDDKIYVPVKNNNMVEYDGRLWKPKVTDMSTNLGKQYVKRSKYNMQNQFLKWLSTKPKDYDFTMKDFFEETGAYTTRPKRYDHYLRSLDDDGYLESIVTPGCQTRYFVRKKFKKHRK